MATTVQIELMVDEKGAIQGVRSFDTAVKGSAGSVNQLDATLQKLNVHLDQLGQRGKQAFREVEQEALSSREGTHLLTEEFGVEMPRAFKTLIAQSSLAKTAISAVGTGIIALGAIQIGWMIFKEAYEGAKKLYDEFLNVDKALREYEEEARKAASIKLFDQADMQMQISMLGDVQREMDQLYDKKKKYSGAGNFMASFLGGQGFDFFSAGDQKRLNELQTTADTQKLKGIEEQRKEDLRRLENEQRVAESAAPEYSRSAVEKKYSYRRADVNQTYNQRRDQYLVDIYNRGLDHVDENGHDLSKDRKQLPDDDGWQERLATRQDADAKFHSNSIEQTRATKEEIIRLEDEAQQVNLQGILLLEAQRDAADRAWIRQHGMSSQAIKAIDAKFYAEERKLLDEQRRQTEEMQGQDALGSFKGIGHIQAQGVVDIAKINGDKALPDEEKAKRIQSVKDRVNAEILDQERTFTAEVDALRDEQTVHALRGFAQIEAAAAKALAEKQRAFDIQTSQIDRSTPEGETAYQNFSTEFNRQKGLIQTGANQDASERTRHNSEETLQIELEARAHSMSAEKQQTVAIQAEYEARTQKYFDELSHREIGEEDYNRRVLAAGEQRDADLVAAAKAAREKMAGEFSHFFSNPMQALKEFGNKAAGEAAAALVQRAQNHLGGRGGTAETAPGGGWSDSLFERIAGMPHGPNDRQIEGRNAHGSTGMLSLGTAQIRIGSATIAMGGSMGSGGFTPGSTSLIGGAQVSPALSTSSAGSFGTGGAAATNGAGDAGWNSGTAAGTVSFAGAGGTVPAMVGASNGVGSGVATVDQGLGLFSQGKSMLGGLFGSKGPKSDAASGLAETESTDLSGSFDKLGNFQLGKSGTGMLNGGGFKSNAMGAAGGAMGLFSAFEGNGGVGGALSGAMSGMQLGMSLGGPLGGAIGAAGGALIGALGFGGREKARVYDLKTVRPRITSDTLSYQQGGMDYSSAYSDLQSLDVEAKKSLRAMGSFGGRYYDDTVKEEIRQAEGKLTAEQRAGRSNYTPGLASYDIGADSVPHDGIAKIHENERIMPSDQNERITRALEAGASSESIARGYRAAMSAPSARQSAGGGDRTVNMNFHTLDSKTVARMFMENKHHVRAALNASYAENSGGADA